MLPLEGTRHSRQPKDESPLTWLEYSDNILSIDIKESRYRVCICRKTCLWETVPVLTTDSWQCAGVPCLKTVINILLCYLKSLIWYQYRSVDRHVIKLYCWRCDFQPDYRTTDLPLDREGRSIDHDLIVRMDAKCKNWLVFVSLLPSRRMSRQWSRSTCRQWQSLCVY